MAKYLVDYYETYSRSYEIEADSKEEAEEKVRYEIQEGKLDPPENCSDSWCEIEEMEVDFMTILSEMPTGMGGKWILAKFTDTFYGYGVEADFKCAWGLPVNQCGTKDEVLENCLRMQEVNKEYIKKYQNNDTYKILFESEQKELAMHTEFARILSMN